MYVTYTCVCVCVYIYIYIYIYVYLPAVCLCVYVYICMYVSIYVYILCNRVLISTYLDVAIKHRVCKCVCVYACACACVCVCIHILIHPSQERSPYWMMCVYACSYLCVYVYVRKKYTHIHILVGKAPTLNDTYICIYTYTYIHTYIREGPHIEWKGGRKDSIDPKDATPDGRLPVEDKGMSADQEHAHMLCLVCRSRPCTHVVSRLQIKSMHTYCVSYRFMCDGRLLVEGKRNSKRTTVCLCMPYVESCLGWQINETSCEFNLMYM
jgi:hypothetical protein